MIFIIVSWRAAKTISPHRRPQALPRLDFVLGMPDDVLTPWVEIALIVGLAT